MADQFLAEIRIFPFNFAPTGWAFCDGQLMPIIQNTALFSLLGTTYGGNGTTNFALPNLQGSAPIGPGQGTGLSLRDIGETGGEPTVELLQSEVPTHVHSLQASNQNGTLNQPGPQNSLARTDPAFAYTPTGVATKLAAGALGGAVGGNAPHNNMMPYLTLNFCIALEGYFPPRT